MKYRYCGKSLGTKNVRFYIGASLYLYKSIRIQYFHDDTLIGRSLFEEPKGKQYLYKFLIDLWVFRFEAEVRVTKLGDMSPESPKICDDTDIILINTGEEKQ